MLDEGDLDAWDSEVKWILVVTQVLSSKRPDWNLHFPTPYPAFCFPPSQSGNFTLRKLIIGCPNIGLNAHISFGLRKVNKTMASYGPWPVADRAVLPHWNQAWAPCGEMWRSCLPLWFPSLCHLCWNVCPITFLSPGVIYSDFQLL